MPAMERIYGVILKFILYLLLSGMNVKSELEIVEQ